MLKEIHPSHLGMNKCKSLARGYIYWPNIDKDIETMCTDCIICKSISSNPIKSSLSPWPQTRKP